MAKLIKRDVAELTVQTSREALQQQSKRGPIIDKETFEAKSEAVHIRDRAIAQAEEIAAKGAQNAEGVLAQAEREAETLRKQAHEQGFAEGQREGLEQLSAAAVRLAERADALQAELAPQIVSLSMGIAKRILGRELEFNPDSVVDLVKRLLTEKARQRREITLRVHPEDLDILKQNKANLVDALSRTKEIAIQADDHVQRHGVIIETEAGTIDAQLDVQMAALEMALQGVRE